MLPKFEILKPATLAEASAMKKQYGDAARFYAGGTDILVMMREGKMSVEYLIDIKGLAELKNIKTLECGCLKIGAACTFNEIIANEKIKSDYPELVDGMARIGSLQVRNLATIGGNIANAIPSADSAPCLLIADAKVEIASAEGIRQVPVCEFWLGHRKTVLQEGELISAFILPAKKPNAGAYYYKYTRRKAMDIALFGVGVYVEMTDGKCTDARVAMATAAPTPIRVKEAEEYMIGKALTEEELKQAGEIAAAAINPRSSVRSSAEYRKQLAKVLTPRAAAKALSRVKA